jgi:cytochrome P450
MRWKHRRALFNPAFNKQVLNSFFDEFNSKGNLLLEKLSRMADGKQQVNMLENFSKVTLDSIASVKAYY